MAAATGSLIMAGSSIAGGFANSSAQRAQGEYARNQAYQNALNAEAQAADAERRGEKDAQQIRRQTRNLVGDQRVAAAAAGLDVNAGSVGDVQGEAMAMGEADVATAKTNAWREAWGFKSQASSYRAGGDAALRSGKNQANSTILTSGLAGLSNSAEGIAKSKSAKLAEEQAKKVKT